jgi:uncharacterized membrane-anchored protein YhcB (DUF1043 family)
MFESENLTQIIDLTQVSAICVAMLVIGVTIGMYVEKVFQWRSKKTTNNDSNLNLTEEQKELLKTKPEKVLTFWNLSSATVVDCLFWGFTGTETHCSNYGWQSTIW